MQDDFLKKAEGNNTAAGLFAVAAAIVDQSGSIRRLGLADAMAPMGAPEVISKEIRDGFERLAHSIDAFPSSD